MPEALIPFCFSPAASWFRAEISDPQVSEALGRGRVTTFSGATPLAAPLDTTRPSGLWACLGALAPVTA